MAITTYSGLLTELTRLIDGEDVSASEVPAATLAQIIHFGELTVYREARTRFNEKAWDITVTNNLAALPADFVAPSLVHFGKKPLSPVSENFMSDFLDDNPNGAPCLYFCEAGPNLTFGPPVTDTTALLGRYYYKMPDLNESTLAANTLFAAAEDLFLYAALMESAPFFGQDARIPLWTAKYSKIRDDMNRLSAREAYSSGRIQVRPSTRLKR